MYIMRQEFRPYRKGSVWRMCWKKEKGLVMDYTKIIRGTIGLLSSMVRGGENHSDVSERQHDNPPPPRSLMTFTHLASTASIVASISNFSKKGSGI